MNKRFFLASEVFQFQDIPQCRNIAAQHGQTLRILLQRLLEKNITLNKNECVFDKQELKFMDHVLSSRDIKTDDRKIRAVRKFKTQTDSAVGKRFIDLV